jgi:hypothetical protein
MSRPRRAKTKEIKCSEDLVEFMNSVGMLHGLPVRDVVDAIVGDYYLRCQQDDMARDVVINSHVERTDARPAFCYLDERGLSRLKSKRDQRLRHAKIHESPHPGALPDWLK